MKYLEAMNEMKTGKHLTRAKWDHVDEAGNMDPKFCMLAGHPVCGNINFVLQVRYKPNPGFTNFQPLMEDLDATDWYVLDTSYNANLTQEIVQEVGEVVEE